MKNIVAVSAVFMLLSCGHGNKPDIKSSNHKTIGEEVPVAGTTEKPMIQYTDLQLKTFLDSVGHLPTQTLADKVAFGADSVFRSPSQLDTVIAAADMKILKRAIHKGVMSAKLARRIFNNNAISDFCNSKSLFVTLKEGQIAVLYYPFNVRKGEYGVCVGDPSNCQNAFLYFFKGDKILARHKIYTRHGPELKWFKDEDGESVIYYTNEFDEGSGIWWFNYCFYKYDGNSIKPVLNIPQNINLLQPSPWGLRELWLECIIKQTNPLTIKMIYHQQLPDTTKFDHFTTDAIVSPMVVNDSTLVKYLWNIQSKRYEGQYNSAKITYPQILSYYLVDNELLFINAYYKNIKSIFNDKQKKIWVTNYLNKVKNHEAGNKTEE